MEKIDSSRCTASLRPLAQGQWSVHRVRKALVASYKNVANDAVDICVAATLRHPLRRGKATEPPPLQSAHRLRESLSEERIAKWAQIRSMFAEEGAIFPVGLPPPRKGVVTHVNDPYARITPLLLRFGSLCLEQLKALQRWLDEFIAEIGEIFQSNESASGSLSFRRNGTVIAIGVVSTVGVPSPFSNCWQFAVWLGLTPMQRSTGGKTGLGGVAKRGDTCLRTMLVKGPCAVMHFANRRDVRHGRCVKAVMQRCHASIAAVALLNKMARIA
ncbi:transposase [Burkholderia sp. D7]|nr:transposase [Burkholderia sp. D7]